MDAAASALLAASAAYALASFPPAASVVAAGSGLTLVVCFAILRRIAPEQRDPVVMFQPSALFDQPADELLLTAADRLPYPADAAIPPAAELVLDDILAEIEPDARVVRLFDRLAMPTPGQLMARIDRHLDGDRPQTAPPDASQDLYEALASLRRSLR